MLSILEIAISQRSSLPFWLWAHGNSKQVSTVASELCCFNIFTSMSHSICCFWMSKINFNTERTQIRSQDCGKVWKYLSPWTWFGWSLQRSSQLCTQNHWTYQFNRGSRRIKQNERVSRKDKMYFKLSLPFLVTI